MHCMTNKLKNENTVYICISNVYICKTLTTTERARLSYRSRRNGNIAQVWDKKKSKTNPKDLWQEFQRQSSTVRSVLRHCGRTLGSDTWVQPEGPECHTQYLPAPCPLQSICQCWRLASPLHNIQFPDRRRRQAVPTSGGNGPDTRRILSTVPRVPKVWLKSKITSSIIGIKQFPFYVRWQYWSNVVEMPFHITNRTYRQGESPSL